jgi:hypothetical protein
MEGAVLITVERTIVALVLTAVALVFMATQIHAQKWGQSNFIAM